MVGAPEISAGEVGRRMRDGDVLLVDVREMDEWEEGRIPGAVHAPLSGFGESARGLLEERGREIVVYCRSGNRSTRAAEYLLGMGHPRVSNMEGGILAWDGCTVRG